MQIFSNSAVTPALASPQPEDVGSSGSDSTSSASTSSSATISANDFLQLLVSEMKNQDPTADTDPNEYINQLVQVNSLEQLISINQDLTPTSSSGTSGVVGQQLRRRRWSGVRRRHHTKQCGNRRSRESECSDYRRLRLAHRERPGERRANACTQFFGQPTRFRPQHPEDPRAAGAHSHFQPGALNPRAAISRRNHVIFFDSADRAQSFVRGARYHRQQSFQHEHDGFQEPERNFQRPLLSAGRHHGLG